MPRCLLVDDDRDGREGYSEYLHAYGFDVVAHADAESALRSLAELRPDIMLVDLQLPGLSGWELIRQARALAAELPIVAFTACVFPDDRRRAEEAGCNAFLTKPLPPGDVLAELNRLLKLKRRTQRPVGMTDAQ